MDNCFPHGQEHSTRAWILISLWIYYCTIVQEKIIYKYGRRSCPILVLTTVSGRPRRADAKTNVKNYQGPTTS